MTLKSSWDNFLRFFWIGTWILIFNAPGAFLWAQKNPIAVIKEEIQVGGADVASLPADTHATHICRLSQLPELLRIEFNTLGGKPCRVKLPLTGQPSVNLEKTAVIAFQIRGSHDVQSFQVGMEAGGQVEFVSPIFEYLPQSVISSWSQTGIPMREFSAKGVNLSRAEKLVFEFKEPGAGTVDVKRIAFVPAKPDMKNWEPIVVLLKEYQINNISEFKTLSLGHYGMEFGWKTSNIYHAGNQSPHAARVPASQLMSKKPPLSNGYTLVANFDEGLENNLDGFFNEFQKFPSTTFVTLTSEIKRGQFGRSLEITYDKKTGGFCGAWVHFFNFKLPPTKRIYLDASAFRTLSFWVRGEKGGEDAGIQLADAAWEKIEDSVYYGNLSDHLPTGITQQWQQIRIPLKKSFYKNLNFGKLAGLTLNMQRPGGGTFYIDDIAFLTSEKASPEPAQRAPLSADNHPALQNKKKNLKKAIWIWHTTRLLESQTAQKEFFSFCSEQGVNLVFFQMQYTLQKQKDDHYKCFLKYQKELKRFIGAASRLGIDIHSLDGFSRFALKPWHEKVLSQIRAVIDYNKSVPAAQRFAGIHHDNEPYLIPAYWGVIREDVMRQYFELCEKSQQLVRASGLSNFVFGVDIPFWYEELNFDFDVPVEISWKGVRKPASYHIIDIVDNVGIMDYRTKSYGADGTIVHGRDEIAYANQAGKKILIGLETFPLPHEIFGVFRDDKLAFLTNLEQKISFNTRQLFMLTDQYEDLGILYLRRFRPDVKDTPKQISQEISTLKIQHKEKIYRSDIGVDVPSAKLSFAGMGKDYFTKIHEETIDYFLKEPSFDGTAIHYYETYKDLMKD